MTTNDQARAEALARIHEKTEQLERVQALANVAVKSAGDDRARAIKAALAMMSAKEVAAAMNVTVQRVYKIAREIE